MKKISKSLRREAIEFAGCMATWWQKKKISKSLRREAIEFAGCMATWWQNDTGPACQGDVESEFPAAAVLLAAAARDLVESTEDFYDHWCDVEGMNGSHRYSGALWAEAQAMLLDGWTP